MALLAELYHSSRSADRHILEADATVRGSDQLPVDALVADLSVTGCLLESAKPLVVGSVVTIGIAGVGRQQARIMRAAGHRYGCEFTIALTAAEVVAALTMPADMIVTLPPWQTASVGEADDLPEIVKLPRAVRLAILISATVVSWAVVIGAAAWLL